MHSFHNYLSASIIVFRFASIFSSVALHTSQNGLPPFPTFVSPTAFTSTRCGASCLHETSTLPLPRRCCTSTSSGACRWRLTRCVCVCVCVCVCASMFSFHFILCSSPSCPFFSPFVLLYFPFSVAFINRALSLFSSPYFARFHRS